MKAAWDRGINTIDTANIYSNGYSEIAIGKFIKKVGVFVPEAFALTLTSLV
jgi:aryl-alcohol dehydrogenase-like predicted oxidoreductase